MVKIKKNEKYRAVALFILMFVPMYLLAQKGKVNDNYSYQVRNEYSDLNNDGKEDKVLVTMDTIDETRPLKLQIFLSQPDGKLILAVSSTKIIEPQYPSENKGKFNGFQIPSFFIEHGILQMRSEIGNGNISYDFKYKNGNFELIHVSKLINNSTEALLMNIRHSRILSLTWSQASELKLMIN